MTSPLRGPPLNRGVGRLTEDLVAELMTSEELDQFERKWRIIFTIFAVLFAGALLDHVLRSPHGAEALWCYSLGAFGLIVCLWAASKLRDAASQDAVTGGVELLGEDLSIGDSDD